MKNRIKSAFIPSTRAEWLVTAGLIAIQAGRLIYARRQRRQLQASLVYVPIPEIGIPDAIEDYREPAYVCTVGDECQGCEEERLIDDADSEEYRPYVGI